jgi:sulfonate dioxygenase
VSVLLSKDGEASNCAVTRYIVGYKKEESDWLLKFLYDHIALSQDLQTRVRWLPGTVVVWDVSILSLHSGKY